MSADPQGAEPANASELDAIHSGQVHDPHGRLLLEYWKAKCGADGLPGRARIDPLEMRSFLSCTVLIDVERHDGWMRFKYRLAGTHVVRMFGREVTGHYLDDLNSEQGGAAMHDHLTAVVRTLKATSGQAVAPLVRGRREIAYQHVTVPLARDGANVDMLMGVRCPLLLPTPARGRSSSEAFVRAYF
jgi:hypothetical protein